MEVDHGQVGRSSRSGWAWSVSAVAGGVIVAMTVVATIVVVAYRNSLDRANPGQQSAGGDGP